MHIYIQYNNHLKTLQVSPNVTIGQLFTHILHKLHVNAEQVLQMVHNYSILGIAPMNFEKKLQVAGLHEQSMIFVILNHYPDLTASFSHSTIELYNQWLSRENRPLDDEVVFDPIFTNRVHASTVESTTAPVPQTTETVPTSANTPRNPGVNLFNAILNDITNALSSTEGFHISTYNIHLPDLTDVPVTLSTDQFDSLRKSTFGVVALEYRNTHNNEEPYTTCPITSDTFNQDTPVVILSCGHYFSVGGLRTWLCQNNTKCPCCNSDVRDSLPHTNA
jgi:hypothetical protein